MAGMPSNINMQRAAPKVLHELIGDLAAADLERQAPLRLCLRLNALGGIVVEPMIKGTVDAVESAATADLVSSYCERNGEVPGFDE